MRRQEELEKKAAELDRRERELQSHGVAGQSASPLLALSPTVYRTQEVCVYHCANHFSFLHAGRKNNWPPLPDKFPVGPCFYHDISVDIPVEFQKTVKIMYNLWMCKRT